MPAIVRIDIRLDEVTKELLKIIAEKDSRSMTKEIEYLIKKRYEELK